MNSKPLGPITRAAARLAGFVYLERLALTAGLPLPQFLEVLLTKAQNPSFKVATLREIRRRRRSRA